MLKCIVSNPIQYSTLLFSSYYTATLSVKKFPGRYKVQQI